MAWIALTTDDILQRLASAEKTALGTAALGPAQLDTWATVIADVTREVRGYVATASANTLGAGSTIPDELKGAALALAVFYGSSRLPIKINDVRQKAYDAAVALLQRVADGKFTIEQPQTASTEEIASGAPSQVVSSRFRVASSHNLSGL